MVSILKIRSTIYFPEKLKQALEIIKENDESLRSLNQIIVDMLLSNDEVKRVIKNI